MRDGFLVNIILVMVKEFVKGRLGGIVSLGGRKELWKKDVAESRRGRGFLGSFTQD